jgi:hypothetical protein
LADIWSGVTIESLLVAGLAAIPAIVSLAAAWNNWSFSLEGVARRRILRMLSTNSKLIKEALGTLDRLELPNRWWILLVGSAFLGAVSVPFYVVAIYGPSPTSTAYLPVFTAAYAAPLIARAFVHKDATLSLARAPGTTSVALARFEGCFTAGRYLFYVGMSSAAGFGIDVVRHGQGIAPVEYVSQFAVAIAVFYIGLFAYLQLDSYVSYYRRTEEDLIFHFLRDKKLRLDVRLIWGHDPNHDREVAGQVRGIRNGLFVEEDGGWLGEVPWGEIENLEFRVRSSVIETAGVA